MRAEKQNPYPTIALVGRTNVGKSTLFNRLIEQKKAVVSSEAGTTRDRITGVCLWQGRGATIMDTGGQDVELTTDIEVQTIQQAEKAAEEAELIFFVIDGQIGPIPADRAIGRKLAKFRKRVVLVANKCEKAHLRTTAALAPYKALGFGEPIAVSGTTGLGLGDVLDIAWKKLKELKHEPPFYIEKRALNVAFIGRPNVGKSSIVNAILGEERLIVSPIAHTTREPEDIEIDYKDKKIVLIDTAGLRRMSKVSSGVIKRGMEMTLDAIVRTDVCFLLLDASVPPQKEDLRLAGLVRDSKKGCILVINKWDLIEGKTPTTMTDYRKALAGYFPFFTFAPVIFVSAKEKIRTTELLDLALKVQDEREKMIEDESLMALFRRIVVEHKPSRGKGPKHPYIYRIKQIARKPPTFVVTVKGRKDTVHFSYIRFLENRIREEFGFEGTPLKFILEEFGM